MSTRLHVRWCIALCGALMLTLVSLCGFAGTTDTKKSQDAPGAQDPTLPGKQGPLVAPAYEIEPLDVAVGPNVRVNDRLLCPNGRGLLQNETSIVVSGGVIIAAFNDSRGTGCPQQHAAVGWGYSLDGGETFTDGGTLPHSTELNNGDPWLGVSPDGETFYLSGLWRGYSGFGFYRGYVDGNTITWTEPVVIAFSGESMDKEAFVVDPNTGNIYLTYTSLGRGIKATHSTDGGDTWSAPVTIQTGSAQGSFPAVDNNGTVYVACNVGWPSSNQQIAVFRSTDGGQTFPRLTSFPIRVQGVASMDRSPSFPQVAVDLSGGDQDGFLYVVWHGLDPRNILIPFISHSEDGGDTWSMPTHINTDTTNTVHWWPSVSVDDNGNVNVVFLDRRLNPGTARTDLYFAQSTDAGTTFTDVRVTDVSGNWAMIRTDPGFTYAGDYLRAVSYGSDVYTVWPDVRNGDPDIYFARINGGAIALRNKK